MNGEPLFLPAASCSSLAVLTFYSGACAENVAIMTLWVFLWSAGIAFWAENGRRGGTTPWPRNGKEFGDMMHAYNTSRSKENEN